MADVDLEPFSVDDCPVMLRVSTWTWALSIGGERPLEGASCSVFAMMAEVVVYRIYMSWLEGNRRVIGGESRVILIGEKVNNRKFEASVMSEVGGCPGQG